VARHHEEPAELATVIEGLNPLNLQIARDVLKMERIESWVRDQNTSEIFGMRMRFLVPVKLMVRASDLKRAAIALRRLKLT
jgi:hypothetical protein